MGILDFIVLGILGAWAVFAIVYIIKCKKNGKCIGCSGDCSACDVKKKSEELSGDESKGNK